MDGWDLKCNLSVTTSCFNNLEDIHTWRKELGGAGRDDVSLKYSSQLKASEGQS